MKFLLIVLVKTYKTTISPYLGGHCRYIPSCSQYMLESLEKFGPWRGLVLGFKRLSRCHPLGQSGLDGVPDEI